MASLMIEDAEAEEDVFSRGGWGEGLKAVRRGV